MPNQWNERDVLRLTRNCELGNQDDQLHVTAVDGPYMTVRGPDGRHTRTGRDYEFAVKIGEDEEDAALFSWVNDTLTECEGRLREVERRMREVPTARHHAIRLAEVCDRIEEIADKFADTDHTGTS